MTVQLAQFGALAFVALVLLTVLFSSFRWIGPTEVGLLVKRLAWRKLTEDSPVAWRGEAGYQARLLMPGLRFAIWPIYGVEKHPWVQVPAGQIGVVIAQVGAPPPIGAKSGVYKPAFGNFADMALFIREGGQKAVQRPVLSPGSLLPVHPVGFLVLTKDRVYGTPVSPEHAARKGEVFPAYLERAFGLRPEQLDLFRIEPRPTVMVRAEEPPPAPRRARTMQAYAADTAVSFGMPEVGPVDAVVARADASGVIDVVGIVTTFEGDPLPSGAIASRLGDFDDVSQLESREGDVADAHLAEAVLGSKNAEHNNYQDFQLFLDKGGRIGLQHDPLLYGAYALNPFLVSVELVPMLVVKQGEVAVVKAYVGRPTQDTSGREFKFGSLVRPGHRGIWQEPLRTGKYPINPRCYQAEIVPTSIITLNWSDYSSTAHTLDRNLKQISGKSREGFVFAIDLQVQIHVGDTRAARVISMVGTMENLVSEVLQGAVGNHFRDTLQGMKAIEFIERRQAVQVAALEHVRTQLDRYEIETRGVLIQDVVFPKDLVEVLTKREIANQQKETYEAEERAQERRRMMEAAKGQADMQADLAKSAVGKDIAENQALARQSEGRAATNGHRRYGF